MGKILTFKQKQEIARKKAALRMAISSSQNHDPRSLSKSFGLPVEDVELEIRRLSNGA